MFRLFHKQEPDEEATIDRILTHIADEEPLFDIGSMVTTPKIMKELMLEDIRLLLRLHDHGYWGMVPEAVVLSNNHIVAGNRQGRIVSRYEWDANEIMVVSESVETNFPTTKIYFVRDDIVIS